MMTALTNDVLLIEPRLWLAALEEIKTAEAAGVRVAAYQPQSAGIVDVDTINITGVLLPTVPDAYRQWGFNATGYDEIAEAVNAAAVSSKKAIVLNINSGGGLVAGIDLALAAIRKAASAKPVLAYVDGLAASAAYWLASQAHEIYATRFSEVGSIGAYTVMYDTSDAAKSRGNRAVVSRSGDQKGAGIYGDPITDKMKAVQDDAVSDIAGMFMSDVVAVRTQINPADVNSGRTWLAERAKDLGLIDGVVTSAREITIPDLQGAAASEPMPVAEIVAEDNPTPEPIGGNNMPEMNQDAVLAERARVQAISETFKEDPAFARKHIEAGSTIEQAKAEHYDVVMARAEAVKALDDAPRPVASTEATKEPEEGFMAKARRVAFEQGKPLYAVVADLARIDRAGYLAYVGASREE